MESRSDWSELVCCVSCKQVYDLAFPIEELTASPRA